MVEEAVDLDFLIAPVLEEADFAFGPAIYDWNLGEVAGRIEPYEWKEVVLVKVVRARPVRSGKTTNVLPPRDVAFLGSSSIVSRVLCAFPRRQAKKRTWD